MAEILTQLNINHHQTAVSTGKWWSTTTQSKSIEIINPATAKKIATVYTANKDDLAIVISTAQQAFMRWRSLPAPKRGEIIRLIAEELRAKKDLLGTLISLEVGKIKSEADGEVQEMIDMADFAVGLSRMLYGKTMPSERPQHRLYEQWHPLGPIGVITAFNFPMAVWAWNAFIAAICGNTVIWRPASKAVLCAMAVQQICNEVMIKQGYEGVFSLCATDTDLADCLVSDERLPLISFTGSIAVGRHVNEIVAKRLGKTILELSGNNAVIVDESADLRLVLPAIVFGAVGTAGQRCTTIRRLFVHESRLNELQAALIKAYSHVKIGDPLSPETLMGPLIDLKAVATYHQALCELVAQGGKIVYGGKELSGPGYFVQPTIVLAANHWDVVQRETFAPILYLLPYRTFEEAIRWQNQVEQGLSSALFTQRLSHAELFLSELGSDCGIANINISTSGAEIGGAFGGEKHTGGGREAGSDAWKAYMRRQTVTINWGQSMPLAQGIQFEAK